MRAVERKKEGEGVAFLWRENRLFRSRQSKTVLIEKINFTDCTRLNTTYYKTLEQRVTYLLKPNWQKLLLRSEKRKTPNDYPDLNRTGLQPVSKSLEQILGLFHEFKKLPKKRCNHRS